MRIIYVAIIALFVLQTNGVSQTKMSIYTGVGLGTNLGGEIGLGGEFQYKMLSLNAAVGSWTGEFPEHTGAESQFDYDFGVKVYSKIGVFAGVNYGIIGESLSSKDGQTLLDFEKTHGFSFTLGYRHAIYQNIYGLGYLGLTSNERENQLYLFGEKNFIPRIGLIIGYEFGN